MDKKNAATDSRGADASPVRVIDVHVHASPDRIAGAAVVRLETTTGYDLHYDGTPAGGAQFEGYLLAAAVDVGHEPLLDDQRATGGLS